MGNNTEDTAGSDVILTMRQIQKDVVFKKPVGIPKKRNKQKILDEDTYIEVRMLKFNIYLLVIRIAINSL